MGRKHKNWLRIVPYEGGWKLVGQHRGRQIRRQGGDLATLAAQKDALEQEIAPQMQPLRLIRTHLTETQLRDAEAAIQLAAGKRLTELVALGLKLAVKEDVMLSAAAAAYLEHLEHQRKRRARTLEKVGQRLKSFAKVFPGPELLTGIDPNAVEKWVYGPAGAAPLTQLENASVLRAFFGFCIRRGWLAQSPLKVDLRDLRLSARSISRPAVLTPAECWDLLARAKAMPAHRSRPAGALVPYVILSTWCFLRHAEVLRVRPEDIGETHVAIEPVKRGTASYRRVEIPECVRTLLHANKKIYFGKLPWGTVRGPLVAKWQENLLRHTGISMRYQATGDITLTTREAGNSRDTAFQHYIHLPSADEAKAFYTRPASFGVSAAQKL